MRAQSDIYGIMAEFKDPDALIHAVEAAHHEGFRKMDAYTPFPIEEVIHTIHPKERGVQLVVLIFGLTGALSGFILQSIGAFLDYPINVGGRPLDLGGWPAFIPITFESGILLAAFAATFGMLAFNGLPMPYHPVFNVPRFERASQDAFFFCIEATDPKFDRFATSQFLASLNPIQVSEVPH